MTIEKTSFRLPDMYLVVVESENAQNDKEMYEEFTRFMKQNGAVLFSKYSFTFYGKDEEFIKEFNEKLHQMAEKVLLEGECIMIMGPISKDAMKIGFAPTNTRDFKITGG